MCGTKALKSVVSYASSGVPMKTPDCADVAHITTCAPHIHTLLEQRAHVDAEPIDPYAKDPQRTPRLFSLLKGRPLRLHEDASRAYSCTPLSMLHAFCPAQEETCSFRACKDSEGVITSNTPRYVIGLQEHSTDTLSVSRSSNTVAPDSILWK